MEYLTNKISIILIIFCIFKLNFVQNKDLKISLVNSDDNKYLLNNMYFGDHLTQYQMIFDLNSDYILIFNQTIQQCQYEEKQERKQQKNDQEKYNSKYDAFDLNDIICQQQQISGQYTCESTCQELGQNITLKRNEYSLYGNLINDAIGFNVDIQDIIFSNFVLVYQQQKEDQLRNPQQQQKQQFSNQIQKKSSYQQLLQKTLKKNHKNYEDQNQQQDLEQIIQYGTFGLPNSDNNIIYELQDKNITSSSKFIIDFNQENKNILFLEEIEESQFQYTKILNNDQQEWDLQINDLIIGDTFSIMNNNQTYQQQQNTTQHNMQKSLKKQPNTDIQLEPSKTYFEGQFISYKSPINLNQYTIDNLVSYIKNNSNYNFSAQINETNNHLLLVFDTEQSEDDSNQQQQQQQQQQNQKDEQIQSNQKGHENQQDKCNQFLTLIPDFKFMIQNVNASNSDIQFVYKGQNLVSNINLNTDNKQCEFELDVYLDNNHESGEANPIDLSLMFLENQQILFDIDNQQIGFKIQKQKEEQKQQQQQQQQLVQQTINLQNYETQNAVEFVLNFKYIIGLIAGICAVVIVLYLKIKRKRWQKQQQQIDQYQQQQEQGFNFKNSHIFSSSNNNSSSISIYNF